MCVREYKEREHSCTPMSINYIDQNGGDYNEATKILKSNHQLINHVNNS